MIRAGTDVITEEMIQEERMLQEQGEGVQEQLRQAVSRTAVKKAKRE